MRARLGWVSDFVNWWFAKGRKPRRSARPRPEQLEQRIALATVAGAAPAGCACPFCSPTAAPYVLAGNSGNAYTASGYRWNQPGGLGSALTITYSYSNLLDGRIGLSAATVKAAMQEAMGRWAAVAPLRFVEVADSGPAPSQTNYNQGSSAMIRFGYLAIDGANNTLAYAYYPGQAGLSGDVIFDISERWSINPSGSAFDILEVATHELGHALGLGHEPMPSSGGKNAIMNPYYGNRFNGLGTSYLLADDVNGIRAQYGQGVGSVTTLGAPAAPTSAFRVSGGALYVTGTGGNDVFVFAPNGTASPTVSLNGTAYTGGFAGVTQVVFDGRSGSDKAVVTGTSAAERATLAPGTLYMAGGAWAVRATNSEAVEVTGSANDTVTMTDSAGADDLVSSPAQATLSGTGFSLRAKGFGSVVATSASGGGDVAWMYDSTGADLFVATPTTARLYGSGHSTTANNFRIAYGFLTGGGDTATLTGSAGADTAAGRPSSASITGATFTVGVQGSPNVTLNSGGGADSVVLTGTAGSDTAATTPGRMTLTGAGYRLTANSFAAARAVSGGGYDTGTMTGTSGGDYAVLRPTTAWLRGSDLSWAYLLANFADVRLVGAGGFDLADAHDSSNADTIALRPTGVTLSNGNYRVQVSGFNRTFVWGHGGADTVTVYDSAGDDSLGVIAGLVWIRYPAMYAQLTGFGALAVNGGAGGTNRRYGSGYKPGITYVNDTWLNS